MGDALRCSNSLQSANPTGSLRTKMTRAIKLAALLIPTLCFGRARTSGYCEQGGQVAVTAPVGGLYYITASNPLAIAARF